MGDGGTEALGKDVESERARQVVPLMFLFGTMYFVQGVAEPTEGLISQPVRSMLLSWGQSPGEISAFFTLLAMPWWFKPFYGFLSDFAPIAGSRRRNYLLVTTFATVAVLVALYLFPVAKGDSRSLLILLLIPTVGIAFSDVVIDAYMIERAQPLGLTGRIQSVQWALAYTASIMTGFISGYLSEHGLYSLAFLVCAAITAISFVVVHWLVKDVPRPDSDKDTFYLAWRAMLRVVTQSRLLLIALFIFLWSFNPFSSTVLHYYATQELQLSESYYGALTSIFSVGSIAGSVTYGFVCRAIPFRWLVHGSIVAGIYSTLAYSYFENENSAAVVSFVVGFTYLFGSLVLLDLAARTLPLEGVGTSFAVIMAISNFGLSLSTGLGGYFFETWAAEWGADVAFQALVVVGAMFTAGCWFIVPWINAEPGQQAAE